jgi:hypothetical protein
LLLLQLRETLLMLIAWRHHCCSSLAVASGDGEVVDGKTLTRTISMSA